MLFFEKNCPLPHLEMHDAVIVSEVLSFIYLYLKTYQVSKSQFF